MSINRIQILPDEVASRIAAGEVVERPASVVKELFENAIDAKSQQVIIWIENAGRRLIEVADDGEGIPSNQLTLAIARHSTSKLRSSEELLSISSLGFRGEALASIASVSRMTLTSRTIGSPLAASLQIDAGKVRELVQIGAPLGTVVKVEDLFYSVPARLKFLKKDVTERRKINALVTRYAIAYPNIRIRLLQDGRQIIQTSGKGDRREALANLYGVELANQMLEISLEDLSMKVKGFISPVGLTRSNRREINFFVNGRWIQDVALTSALLQAYRTLIMVGRYPIAMLFLDIAPEDVDVNVHPAKAEVRFRSNDRVFSIVQRAVRRGLLAFSPVPQVYQSTWRRGYSDEINVPAMQRANSSWETNVTGIKTDAQQPQSGQIDYVPEKITAQPAFQTNNMPLLRLVGQVGATYLVAEGPDGLYLIDQHAAHERVLFERFMQLRSGSIPSQALLEPLTFNLPPQNAQLLVEKVPFLGELGFEVEIFGPNSFRVSAIPALLIGSDPVAAVRVVVEDFEEDETPLKNELEAQLIARICKRAAVKGGQTLSEEEQRALLRDLEACQSPRTCPHGRPTMIHLSVDLLERQFGRRGAR